MGEVLEALKRNKFLNKATTPEERARRISCLSGIVLDYNDETFRRLADTGKEQRGVTTAAMYHLSATMYYLYGRRKP